MSNPHPERSRELSAILGRDWRVLLDSLDRQNCVVLLGPHLRASGSEGGPGDLTADLSRRLARILEEEDGVKVANPENLALVAQIFIDRNARVDLEVEVGDFYREVEQRLESGPRDDVLESLAALPIPLFVTSRHDRTLQHYLRRHGKEPTELAYDFLGDQLRCIGTLGSSDRPLVYQLFGSVANGPSLALTEGNLLDLLAAIISSNPALPVDLQNHFVERSFLFLGCGLYKDYLRFLLHALGLSRSRQRSFALEPTPARGGPAAQAQSVWFYEVEYRRLKFLDVEEGTFLGELRQRWGERHSEAGFQPATNGYADAVPERPRAFISYMSEDRPVAERLARSLEARGIEPWIDTDRITVGSQWQHTLDDAIGKESDFFIVLLSRHLADGVETYVHSEVRAALARMQMRGAVKFIYPIQVDDGAGRLELIDRAGIQAWPLGEIEAGAGELAKDIKREFAKLRRR